MQELCQKSRQELHHLTQQDFLAPVSRTVPPVLTRAVPPAITYTRTVPPALIRELCCHSRKELCHKSRQELYHHSRKLCGTGPDKNCATSPDKNCATSPDKNCAAMQLNIIKVILYTRFISHSALLLARVKQTNHCFCIN